MIKRFLNRQSRTIMSAAVVLAAASFVSRLLGVVRDRIIASAFGAGNELDAYYAAFRIPDLIFSLLVFGAVSAGFVPVFVSYLKKDKEESWRMANGAFNLMALSLASVCLSAIIFAPYLMKFVAPGFAEEKKILAVGLMRIMFLSPFFLGLSAIFGGVLQSFRCFLSYSLGPIAYNIGIIFGAMFLTDRFGIFGLAYGVVVGAVLHMLIRFPATYAHGFRWQPILGLRSQSIRRISRLVPARVLSVFISQINLWALTFFASMLAAGSVAVSSLAYNFWCFPIGIFGVSFSLAVFPQLSESVQERSFDEFADVFFTALKKILFFVLPSAALLIALRFQIIQVALNAGRFSSEDVLLTANVLAIFSFSLFAEALILLYLRGFFAWEDTKTPFLVGLIATFFRVGLMWWLSSIWGVYGMAYGFSIGGIVNFILLFMAFNVKIGHISKKFAGEKIASFSAKIVFASLSLFVVASLALRFIPAGVGFFGALIQGGLSGLIGLAVYFFVAYVLKVEDLKMFLRFAKVLNDE